MNDPSAADTSDPNFAAAVLRKVTWRLIPFLIVLYIFNIIDRANVGFVRDEIVPEARQKRPGEVASAAEPSRLQLSLAVFNFGYGIFYLGYLAFEVPSNLLMRRVGARRWIARITITWGIVSCTTAFVVGTWSFYGVRILLGVAEAGFFPGIILYLTYWFPARERARIIAWFMTAIALAGVISNPMSGAILKYMDGVQGLQGWQWIFVLEGLPPIILGFVVLAFLKDGPAQASWLTAAERAWLCERMSQEEQARTQRHGADFWRALCDPRIWFLICLYFTVAVAANAAGAYVPNLIRQRFTPATAERPDELMIGLLAALPHVCAILGMTLWGTHSDRTGERKLHVALAAFGAAAGWALAAWAQAPWLALLGFCLAQMWMMSMLPVFWAIPTSFLSGAAAAGGIALINSVANIGGWFGATIFGSCDAWAKDEGIRNGGMWGMAVILGVGGLLALCLTKNITGGADPRDSMTRPAA